MLVAAIFTTINPLAVATWTGFGVGLRRLLDRPTVLRAFNLGMAGLLVISRAPRFLERARGFEVRVSA